MQRLLAAAAVVSLLGSSIPSRAEDAVPCDARRVRIASDAGWRVQVDPDTGIYSLPASTGTSTATSARTTGELVVTPGRTAAGGYKIDLGDAPGGTREQQ